MNFGKETEEIEFKASLSQTARALEALSAMLNKHGKGTVYFGVDNHGEAKGICVGNDSMKDLSVAITTRIKPQVIPTIVLESHDGKEIIKVSVDGTNKPYSADGNYLIRSGCENKKIDPEKMRELLFSNSYEMILGMESVNQDLAFSQLKQLYVLNGLSIDDRTFEKNCGLLCKNGMYNVLAEILSDSNDFSIKVVRFKGKDKSEMIVRNEYGYRCLILAMQNALDYIDSLNETKVTLDGNLRRAETKLFDERSLREAWVNACLHTNWSRLIPPAIYVYSDRMEIMSTGGLPVDFSVEDFYSGISRPINRQLQKIMGQLNIVEQTGHGVTEIINRYGREAFTIRDNYLMVTLKFPFELETRNPDLDILTLTQRRIYSAIKNKPSIRIRELSEVLGLSVSTVNSALRELKQLNRIERIGSNKAGYWKVNES